MKRVTINLIGTVMRGASRSFVIEIPDDVNVKTLDPHVLESIADEARVPWEFQSEGFVQVTDHTVEEETQPTLPVIKFKKTPDSPEAVP